MSARRGAVVGWLLAVVVLGAVVATAAGVVLAGVLAQGAVYLATVRSGRAGPWQRFAALWSVQAGATWLVAGDDSITSGAVYVAVGLVFAVVAHLVLALMGRAAGPDTAPLPVVEPEPGSPCGFVQDPDGGPARE